MAKAQEVSFRNVSECLGYLPPEELAIVERLRSLIFECIPDAEERLAYNVPFYYRHRRIVYLWPGSVPWGRKVKPGVDLGFCRGHLLSDPSYLETGTRKEVYIKTFHNLRDIDTAVLCSLLYEAALIDAAGERK